MGYVGILFIGFIWITALRYSLQFAQSLFIMHWHFSFFLLFIFIFTVVTNQ